MTIRLIVFFLCCSWPYSLLNADVIFLRGGARIEGRIIAQDRQIVRIQDTTGTRVIDRSSVKRIVYKPYDPGQARQEEEAQRRQQQELLQKRQEDLRREQEAALLQQQQAAAIQQQLDEFERQEAARREAARQAADQAEAAAVAERQEIETPPSTGTDGTPLWLSLLLPGLRQMRGESPGRGSLLAAGTLLGLGATGALATRRAGLVESYRGLDDLVNLVVLNGEGGQSIDLLLSLQRDAVATEINRTTAAQNGAAGLVAALYLVNAVDVLLFGGETTALRLQSTPAYTGLAFDIRF